ncbi:MAG: hypothetical protein J6P07_06855 [Spirochaetaceae bacterium]|nr:hypothetical protein [Spirochaetaceae bacterium]
MKKHIVFNLACLVLFGCFSAYAQTSLNSILSDDVAEELLKNGKIEYSSYMKEYTPKLFLNNAQLGEKTASYWEESGKTQKPVFYFEGIYLTKKAVPTEKGKDMEEITKNVRALSTLAGVEYYSNTRKKMRILYEESYAVNNPEERKRIEDPVNEDPNGQVIYSEQKDSTFGKFLYKYTYFQQDNELLIRITNVDNLTFAGIKIIKPENMMTSILLYDLGDYYLTYTLIKVDVISVSIIENKMTKSFAARAEAMFSWLLTVFDKIDEKNLKGLE